MLEITITLSNTVPMRDEGLEGNRAALAEETKDDPDRRAVAGLGGWRH